MPDEPKPKSQKTTPKGKDKSGKPHEPIEIPVPKRGTVENLIRRAAQSDDLHGKR
jgi:hypothetical protein